jgi:hypothetical protein
MAIVLEIIIEKNTRQVINVKVNDEYNEFV